MMLMAPVSWGELLDKLTILLIKQEKIKDPEKLENINREYRRLNRIREQECIDSPELDDLIGKLLQVNEKLWVIEDDIRQCERQKDFSESFIELARSVYQTNDLRAELKYRINTLLGSELIEEKSYEDY